MQIRGSGKDGRILKEDLIAFADSQSDTSSTSSSESDCEGGTHEAGGLSRKVLATPAVRRVAKEWGVILGDVRGTGESGRVLKEDILSHVEAIKGNLSVVYCGYVV